MKKIGGLQKRWLFNTVGLVFLLGMICVIAVTVVFSAYYYTGMEADLTYRAKTTTDFFSNYINQSYKEFYQSCIDYAKTFDSKNTIELRQAFLPPLGVGMEQYFRIRMARKAVTQFLQIPANFRGVV